MAQIIKGKAIEGRAAHIIVYDLQGTHLSKEFQDALELTLTTFLEERSEGKTKAITVTIE